MPADRNIAADAPAGAGAPEVTVIVVSYQTREMTIACLESLMAQSVGLAMETIVVDNASNDGSADAIAQRFPQMRLIRLDTNIGFAAANNLAATHARGEYLLLLNPDTVVLDHAVQHLLAFARRTPAARIWGGRTLFADGSLNPTSCWMRQTPWSLLCRGFGLSGAFRRSALFNPEAMGSWARDSEREVDVITGCFFLISRADWNALDGFDPAFFMYGEEADLCLRARALGARPRFTPTATITHYGGASESVRADKLVRLLRAKAQLIRRHWSPLTRWFGVWMLAQWSLIHAVAWRVRMMLRNGAGKETAEFWSAGWKRRREWLTEPAPRAHTHAKGGAC